MNNQVWINNDTRKILVSDMPIIPVGYSLVKEYDTWQLAISFADNLNFPLHYDIDYDNEYTRNNYDNDLPYNDDDDDYDIEIDFATDCKCGAWVFAKDGSILHIADCVCGAE